MTRRWMIRAASPMAVAVTALAVTELGLVAPAANATAHDPDGGTCSWNATWSVPAAGKVKITVVTRCGPAVFQINHGITLQRSGNVILSDSDNHCSAISSSFDDHSCTKSFTVNNPAGSQKFEVLDEVQVNTTPTSAVNVRQTRFYSFFR